MCELDPSENITTQVKHGFYSNYMLEALKAKFKDWNNIKITYIPAKHNEVLCPHFLWSDGKYDYDFGTEKYLKWYERIWFYGEIRKRNLGWNERWKKYRVSKKKINAEYYVVGEYIKRYWSHNNIADSVIVSIDTSYDGATYNSHKEIASPIEFDNIEFLNDWWEGERFIKLRGIKSVNELEISGGIYELE